MNRKAINLFLSSERQHKTLKLKLHNLRPPTWKLIYSLVKYSAIAEDVIIWL